MRLTSIHSQADLPLFPSRKSLHRRVLFCCLVALLLALSSFSNHLSAAEATASASQPYITGGSEQARGKLEEAQKALSALPEEAKASDLEKQSRATMQLRIKLLEEYLSQTETLQALERQFAELPTNLRDVQQQLATQQSTPPAVIPDSVSEADYAAVEDLLHQRRDAKSQLLAQKLELQRLDDSHLQSFEAAQRRQDAARLRISRLAESQTPQLSKAEAGLLSEQIDNARLDSQIAELTIQTLEKQRSWFQNSEPLRRLQQELLDRQVEALERQLTAYGAVLEQQVAAQAQQADQALQDKERQAESAASPAERLVASWQAAIARSQKSTRDLQSQLVTLRRDVAEQEKRLATEKDELAAIRSLIAQSGTSGAAADRIKQTLQQIRQRRLLLARAQRNGGIEALNQHRERRFLIEDRLLGLNEQFEREVQEAASLLPEAQRQAFISASQDLPVQLRTALNEERTALTDAIGQGQKLQLITGQRLETVNELQRFIRSRAFWIRDARPFGWQTISNIPKEIREGAHWLAGLASADVRARLTVASASPINILYTLVLFVILPVGLYYARGRIRAVSRSINDRVLAEGKLLYLAVLVLFTAALSSALLPAYFYMVARLISSAQLPAEIGTVAARFFDHLALFLLMWFLARSMLARRSICEVQFNLPRAAANRLYSGLRWFLFGYLLWLLPWNLLRQPPFEFEALPRVFYTLFLLFAVAGVIHLTRSKSAFVGHALEALNAPALTKHWKTFAALFVGAAFATLVLDLAGHRFASQSIMFSLAGTLATLILLPPLYRIMRGRLRQLTEKLGKPQESNAKEDTDAGWKAEQPADTDKAATDSAEKASPPAAAAQEKPPAPAEQPELASKSLRFLRLLFIVIGGLLLLNIWGIDEQALKTLEELQLYKVRITGAEPEFVTAADFLRAILFLVVTFWILRHLPGLYDVALFPYLSLDAGLRYATLTISRYTAFLVGFFFALAEIHLDLGRLAWLMAAIGVGLGFGLREIVSNFASGLILLIERPVKPGDTVTIGNLSGKVDRINIRATTIINFDRQEVMVPNRTLITDNVTNWTHTDTVNRLVVSIGVAYGSDVDRVSELLLQIAKDQPEILKDPAPSVVFVLHGESSLNFDLRVFVPSPAEIMVIRDRLNRLINKAFAAEGINIPFPQRELHIRSDEWRKALGQEDQPPTAKTPVES